MQKPWRSCFKSRCGSQEAKHQKRHTRKASFTQNPRKSHTPCPVSLSVFMHAPNAYSAIWPTRKNLFCISSKKSPEPSLLQIIKQCLIINEIQGSTSPKSCTYIFEGYKDKSSWLSYLEHKRKEMKDEAQLQDYVHRFHFQHHLLLWWYPVCRFVPGHPRCPLRNNFHLHNLAWWCLMEAIKTVKTTTLFNQYKYVVLCSPILEEHKY